MKRKIRNNYFGAAKVSTVNKQDLIDDLIRVSKIINKNTITSTEYAKYGKYSYTKYYLKYGSWSNALELAGLHPVNKRNISEEELFDDFNNLWNTFGRRPYTKELIKPFSKYTYIKYKTKFGTWNNFLEAYKKYMKKNKDNESGDERK